MEFARNNPELLLLTDTLRRADVADAHAAGLQILPEDLKDWFAAGRVFDCQHDRKRNAIGWKRGLRATFMAKPSINSTLTIKFSVRHAIERFHYPRDQ
jgi:hypothetical protein